MAISNIFNCSGQLEYMKGMGTHKNIKDGKKKSWDGSKDDLGECYDKALMICQESC